MEKDPTIYGGNGIDTQLERDILHYRPLLQYDQPQIELNRDQSFTNREEIRQKTSYPVAKAIWEDLVSLMETLHTIESDLSTALKSMSVPLYPHQQEVLTAAAQKWDVSLQGHLPFSLYQTALKSPDSPSKQLILDAFEEYASDVGGNLKAELYPDVVEMIQDWEDTLEFIHMGLFKQISPENLLPKDLTKEDHGIAKLHEIELATAQQIKVLDYQLQQAEAQLKEAVLLGEEAALYKEAFILYDQIKQEKARLEQQLTTKNETAGLITNKLIQTRHTLDILVNVYGFNPYGNDHEQNLYHVIKESISGQPTENGLRKLQTLLKLSIDGKNDTVQELKTNLRNLSGRTNRKKINNTLVNSIHARNHVYYDMLNTMNRLHHTPRSASFETMANHLVDGLGFSNHLYGEQVNDFYKMHLLEAEVRKNKVYNVLDKDAVRQIYQVINSLLVHGGENRSWPTEQTLSSWLSNFFNETKR